MTGMLRDTHDVVGEVDERPPRGPRVLLEERFAAVLDEMSEAEIARLGANENLDWFETTVRTFFNARVLRKQTQVSSIRA